MAYFGKKPWTNPFEKKFQLFAFLNFLFLLPKKAFFAGEYHKTHFPGIYCQKKRR